jgi:hypothetical protein
MGFIKQSITNNQVDLTAYLTQEARKNILDGDREDFQISYFSLSDSDTNYFTSKEIVNSTNNILPSGMVPDITGDYNGVIKSIAGGTLNPKYFLSGSTTNKVGIPGTSGLVGGDIVNISFLNRPTTTQTLIDVYPTLTNVSKSFRYNIQTGTVVRTATGIVPTIISDINTIQNIKYGVSISDITILNSNGTPSDSSLPLNQDIKKLIENSLYFYNSTGNNRSKNLIITNNINTISELRLDFPIRDSRFSNLYPNISSTETLSNIRFNCRIILTPLSFLNIINQSFDYSFSVSNPLINQINGAGGVPQISLSTNARLNISNLILPESINISNIIALKEIEKNEDGSLGFQKTQTRQGTTTVDDSDLKFTKINLDNILNPNANLAMSFNIPITTPQISSYLSRFNNTSLQSIIQPTSNTSTYNNKFILVEIPQNKYGEIIDGKTIELNIPVKSGSTVQNYSLYSTYFRSNTQPNTLNYNTLLSDPNPFSSYFSDVNPSLNNDNNSNTSYLFSNEINKPISTELVLGNSLFSGSTILNSNGYNVPFSSNIPNNTLIQVRIKFNSGTNQNINDLLVFNSNNEYIIEGQSLTNRTFIDPSNSDEPFINRAYYFSVPTVNNDLILNIRNLRSLSQLEGLIILNTGDNINNTGSYNLTITVNILNSVTSESTWNKFTNVNKFSTNSLNNTGNKKWAKYDGALLDKPVGIAFLDKGFLLITDPTIVNNFNYTGATSSGYNNITSGLTYSGGTSEFTRIYFTDTDAANISFDSVTTEYTQNILCLALNNEFITSNNPTYQLAYQDENVKPLYFTQINLHNKNGKIVGIAKTSEPIKRTLSSVNIFNIKLKL